MTIETKRELLKYKILHERVFHDIVSYRILRYSYFDNVINLITDISLTNNIKANNNEFTDRQFLNLLDLFVETVRKQFFNISIMENIIYCVIQSNIDLAEDYFTSTYSINDKENINILYDKIYKLIISNFIKNEKYIPNIYLFLTENKIDIKPVKEYSYEEISKIITLLSDLVFCQRERGNYMYLFHDIENNLKQYLMNYENKRNKRIDKNKFKDKRISDYVKHYDVIFKSYESKRKYIGYFK